MRTSALDCHAAWLKERFKRHAGNADVVRQELISELGITVSLRTIQRALQPYRQDLRADFGERLIEIGGAKMGIYLFVATFGASRRLHVRAFRNERQQSWFDGIESAFREFGGTTKEVLFDNARALVERHNGATREVVFNAKLTAFAKHWRFTPRACAPYRARTKGKTENGVGYVKKNAIAGRRFATFEELEAHLVQWTRDVADTHVHGTTGEPPITRFERDEAAALNSIDGVPPFQTMREVSRKVQSDCRIEFDSNGYWVPWKLIGEHLTVVVADGALRISHAGKEVARHELLTGKHGQAIDPAHFEGVAGADRKPVLASRSCGPPAPDGASPAHSFSRHRLTCISRSHRRNDCDHYRNTKRLPEVAGDGSRI